jgi:hypothetical protein
VVCGDRQGRDPRASPRRRRTPDARLDDDAARTISETRKYLDDADELLRTEKTAVDFFNAGIQRYSDHMGRTVLWVAANALYGVREHPGDDIRQILVTSWL